MRACTEEQSMTRSVGTGALVELNALFPFGYPEPVVDEIGGYCLRHERTIADIVGQIERTMA